MENNANYIRVGAFTLAVIVAAFGFVYWAIFASSGSTRIPLIVRIEGSVTGLQQGSQVLFNGLPVGNVRSLRIDGNNPNVVIATTDVEPTIPIMESTRANIGFAGLTGQAFISLQGGATNEQNILQEAMQQGTVPVIRADPSDVTDILATARDISQRANNILATFENIVTATGPAVETAVNNVASITSNVNEVTEALSANADDLDTFVVSLSGLADVASEVAAELPPLLNQFQTVATAVDPEAIGQTVQNVSDFTGNLRAQSENLGALVSAIQNAAASVDLVAQIIDRNSPAVDSFLANLAPLSENANQLVTRLDGTAEAANELIAGVEPAAIASTLNSLQATASNLSAFSDGLGDYSGQIDAILSAAVQSLNGVQQVAQTIAGRSGEVDSLLANLAPISDNVRTATENIGAASTGLEETVANANQLVTSVDPAAIASTLNSLQATASNLSAFTGGLSDYSGQIDAVLSAAVSSLNGVQQVVQTVTGRSEEVDSLLANLGPISNNVRVVTENVSEASGNLQETVANANQLIAAVDPATLSSSANLLETTLRNVATLSNGFGLYQERFDTLVNAATSSAENVRAITGTVAERSGEVDSLLANLGPISNNLRVVTENASEASAGLQQAVANANRLVETVDPEQVSNVVDNLATAMTNVSEVTQTLSANRERISTTLQGAANAVANVQTITGAVVDRIDDIDSALASLEPVANNIQRSSADLGEAARQARELVASVDSESINRSLSNIEGVTGAVNARTETLQSIFDGVDETVGTLNSALTGFQQTRGRVDELLQAVEPERINRAVTNVSAATDNVAQAADSIAGVANAVGERREDIDGIITDARTTAAQLSAASRRIDGVVQSIDGVLGQAGGFLGGADDGTPLGADLATTLRSIRTAAQSIQGQIDPISASIRTTSDQGIREFRELSRSLSQSIERIQRSINDVSSNPSSIIFGGGDDVRTYDGRNRR